MMGIKKSISKEQLPLKYQKYSLTPTTHGVMASVYLLGERYVLKLFEKETALMMIESEILLLSLLKDLPIPKVVDRFHIEGHEVVIYSQIEGEMHLNPMLPDVQEIGRFLKEFHAQTQKISLETEPLFTQNRLLKLIDSTGSKRLAELYQSIEITLQEDGVIHGDLFPDNCKFIGEGLSGVYDFSDACLGDFHFELAVVAMAWCFDENLLNEERLEALLFAYGSSKSREEFMVYVRFALLYYATTRFLAGRDYDELLERLGKIEFDLDRVESKN